jgi:NDP-sugar pyrophosphorylase family protein
LSITAIIVTVASKTYQSQLTYNRPVTLLPALGKPLVVRMMDRLYRAGIRDFVVILGETEGEVATYLNNRWLADANLQFTIKLESHSLSDVMATMTQNLVQPVLLANYNTFTDHHFPAHLINLHSETPDQLVIGGTQTRFSGAPTRHFCRAALADTPATEIKSTTIAIESIEDVEDPASENDVEINEIAMADESFLRFLQTASPNLRSAYCLMDIFQVYCQEEGHVRLALADWLLQVESDHDLITLNRYLLDEQHGANLLSEIPHSATIHEPVYIDPRVSIGMGATIGPHVYLERGCTVGHNATLENTIVLGGATVGPNEIIRSAIVSTRGVHSQSGG